MTVVGDVAWLNSLHIPMIGRTYVEIMKISMGTSVNGELRNSLILSILTYASGRWE